MQRAIISWLQTIVDMATTHRTQTRDIIVVGKAVVNAVAVAGNVISITFPLKLKLHPARHIIDLHQGLEPKLQNFRFTLYYHPSYTIMIKYLKLVRIAP